MLGRARALVYASPALATISATNLDACISSTRSLAQLGRVRDACIAYSCVLDGTRSLPQGGSAVSAHVTGRSLVGRGLSAASSAWITSSFKQAAVAVVMPDVMKAMTSCSTLASQDLRMVCSTSRTTSSLTHVFPMPLTPPFVLICPCPSFRMRSCCLHIYWLE